jgi:ADP-heptose:LPS heptosyltransferase
VRDESIEHIVVIFPGALGDLLLALPALRALRARHAPAAVTLVVQQRLRTLAAQAGVADATVALESAETAALFAGEALPSWLAARPVVYSWLGAADDGVRARLTPAARHARFFRVERGPGTIHAAVAYARSVGAHASRRALAAAAAIVPAASPAARALWVDIGGPVLAIHPGAGARAKRWDAAGFTRVAEWWRARGGAVVVIAGPAEGDQPLLPDAPLVRDWPLPDLAAVLSRAALYVGNDSGVSHLAGAVGAAGVVLFGPTEPRRWRPLSRRLAALRARATGSGAIALQALPAARVIAACRRRVALTRGDPDTSVALYTLNERHAPASK